MNRIEPSKPLSFGRVLLLGLWFGLAVGFLEIILCAGQTFALNEPLRRHGEHVFWMAPLVDIGLFVVFALLAAVVGILLPHLRGPGALGLGGTLLGFINLRPFFPSVHSAAWLVLSAGVAIFVARVIAAHESGFLVGVRRSVVGLAVIVFGLGFGIPGRHAWREYHASANLPAVSAGAPHVLFLVLDTVRAENLSIYGHKRLTTPNLEKLGKQGVRFDRAVATAPWTLPSHASLFTGHWPSELSADWLCELDGTYPTLAESFAARGYNTAGFVGNVNYCSRAFGLARGFAHYEDYPVSLATFSRSTFLSNQLVRWMRRLRGAGQPGGLKNAEQLNRDFLRWLERHPDRPWFTFINYFDAHDPYLPPATWRTRFGAAQPRDPGPEEFVHYSQSEMAAIEIAYDRCIAYIDEQIGRLLAELDQRGVLKDTLVVVTADHGEHFGEHDLVLHGSSLYRPLLHVPLLISWPGRIPQGATVEQPVSLRDIPATLTQLLGRRGERFPGRSLVSRWLVPPNEIKVEEPIVSEITQRKHVPTSWQVSKGDMRSIVSNGLHYIKNGDGSEELYDFLRDVPEAHNLALTADGQKRLAQFRALARQLGPRSVAQAIAR